MRTRILFSYAINMKYVSANYRTTSKVLKALGNERRLMILDFINKHGSKKLGYSVIRISEILKLPYKAVSQHLLKLESLDLVNRGKWGPEAHFKITNKGKELLDKVFK
jgi:DNA-binding transcriptional ArsR family regulator